MSENPCGPSIYSEKIAELVAIGAAIACNCESCFKFHYKKALQLGISHDDMLMAVETANTVKNSPAKAILSLAHRTLMEPVSNDQKSSECCCSSEKQPDPSKKCC
jgi:AhpD family alkylhydroperoxidase